MRPVRRADAVGDGDGLADRDRARPGHCSRVGVVPARTGVGRAGVERTGDEGRVVRHVPQVVREPEAAGVARARVVQGRGEREGPVRLGGGGRPDVDARAADGDARAADRPAVGIGGGRGDAYGGGGGEFAADGRGHGAGERVGQGAARADGGGSGCGPAARAPAGRRAGAGELRCGRVQFGWRSGRDAQSGGAGGSGVGHDHGEPQPATGLVGGLRRGLRDGERGARGGRRSARAEAQGEKGDEKGDDERGREAVGGTAARGHGVTLPERVRVCARPAAGSGVSAPIALFRPSLSPDRRSPVHPFAQLAFRRGRSGVWGGSSRPAPGRDDPGDSP